MICRKCGKEIINENINTSSNRVVNKVSFKDTVKLSILTLLSTPGKFILLLIITLFFTLFLFIGISTYLYMEKISYELVETSTSADTTSYNNRVIIRKEDNGVLTLDEIDSFRNIKNVSAVVENDIFFDSKIYYAFEEDVDINYYSSSIQPAENLKFIDLLFGRLPKNENEVVLVKDYKYLNKTVYIAADGDETPRACKVVGLLPTSENDAIYVHSSIVETIVERLEMNKTMIYFQTLPADNNLAMLARNYDWYVDDTLKDNEIRVESHTVQSSIGEDRFKEKVYQTIDFYFQSNNNKLNLDDMDLIYHKYTYPATESTVQSGKEYVFNVCVRTSTPSSNGYLNQKNYDKLMEFKTQHYQISLLVNNEKNLASVVSEIEQGPYFCSAKGLIENENQVLLATTFEVIVALAVILLTLGLSLIVYVVLKNVLNSQQKSFLIMRSLGIDGKNIAIQIFIELFFTLLISFVVVLALWLLFKLRNFGGFLTGIHNSSFLVVILIYVVSIVVFAILGFRYSASVISSSIVNKEME